MAKAGTAGAAPASCCQGWGAHWVLPSKFQRVSSQEEQQVPLSDWELMMDTWGQFLPKFTLAWSHHALARGSHMDKPNFNSHKIIWKIPSAWEISL